LRAQRYNLKTQTTVVDNQFSPDAPDEVAFRDHFWGVLKQCDENIQSPTADFEWLAILFEGSFGDMQPKRTETGNFTA
jgi:hypothetical protein